ncbi:MAG: aldolase/citrate lyase family protein [Candidatus Latescibacterota bacterium]
MKTPALRRFRQRLASDEPVYGLWITLEAASITEMAVALGLDWVVIDAEHGHLDWHDILEHLRAAVRSDTVALVRVAELNIGLVKRALDIGADGIVVPWVESAEQARTAVTYAHYPPAGRRGIGAERATCWAQCLRQHVEEAEENVLVVPIVESVQASRSIGELVEVPGVEVFFFGPSDFSSTAGYPGQWEGPGVAEQILVARDVIRAAGKHCGVLATDNDDLQRRAAQGFRMLGLGVDGPLLLRSLHGALQAVHRDRRILTTFVAESESLPAGVEPPARPPEQVRPDRPEVINPVGSGPRAELAGGVVFECLVGAHNQARSLTTGITTFAPGARLPYHTHPCSDSLTLLAGQATVEVEGRIYALEPLDNVTVPAGLAHSISNRSARAPAVFHSAMPTSRPESAPVERFYSRRAAPSDPSGQQGGERVTRTATAPRYEPGPATSFVDFFNRGLMPGIEMSGGYGRFSRGGRLPAHVHDFDESICIIEGSATCVVEGRRYALSERATALQPRGRVHYFVNESEEPMAMLWVYAGPEPRRLVVAEECATAAGSPWR